MSNQRGGYQQKRGGGQTNQNRGGGQQKQQDSQQNSNQYVKKSTVNQGFDQDPALISSSIANTNQNASNQMTAEEKFNLLLSGGGLDALSGMLGGSSVPITKNIQEETKEINVPQTKQQSQPKKTTNRKMYAKDVFISKYVAREEVNITLYDKDVLKWVEIFSSGSQDPENLVATDKENDNTQIQSQAKSGQGIPNKFTKPGSQWRGGGPSRPPFGALEDDENEQDPEWVDFDPTKDKTAFFGRAIQNEDEIRDNIKKDKERKLQAWGGRQRKDTDEDEFEKLIREEKEQARKKALLDNEFTQKAEALASDLEHDRRNYSDIDMIYEKNAKKRDQNLMNDDQLADLFDSLMQEEEQKKPAETKPVQQQPKPQVVDSNVQQLPQNIQQQIKDLTQQQKQQVQMQKIITTQKPRFTALQNIQNMFNNLPVVTHEKHRIKMEDIAEMPPEENKGDLFKQLMASINPFSKFVIEECKQPGEEEQPWKLEPAIFTKPPEEISEESLKKSSSEMFVIYKFFSDPLIKVKSKQFTNDEYIEIKDLFPKDNLLQTNPLSVQLAVQNQMIQQQQQQMMRMQQQQMQQQPATQTLQPSSQAFIPRKNSQTISQTTQPAQQTQQQEQQQQQKSVEIPVQSQQQEVPGLSDMESQLKSLLGFNPR